jgi:opacity protein-like surface antigen
MKGLVKLIFLIAVLLFVKVVVAEEDSQYYVGLSGGFTDSILGSPDNGPATAGAAFSGQPYGNNLDLDYTLGIKAGWLHSDYWRFDLAYQHLGGDMDWQTRFPGVPVDGIFAADFESNVILVNAYLSLKSFGKFKPYAGVGIGAAFNELDSISEAAVGIPVFAFPEDNTTTEFAYRFMLGGNYSLTDAWKLDFELSMMNIGDFSSGNSRTFLGGAQQPIGKYKFEDTWIGSATIGIQYHF